MFNPHLKEVKKSATLKITSLTKKLIKEKKDAVNFAAGELDFDTPSFVKEKAIEAIKEGFTKYTPSTGILELKEKIAEKLKKENKIMVGPENIIITTGAKFAVFVGIFSLLEENQEVIIPSPYWVSYPEMVKLAGGKIKFLPTRRENDFKIDLDDLKKAITPKTKLLILNYPNNPTGQTYSYEELKNIYEFLKDKNIFVISDEIYEKLVYDGISHTSFSSFPDALEFTLMVDGFSKTFSMTGWRLGYLVAKEEIIQQASKIVDHTTSCAVSISQKAALVSLEHPEWIEKIRREFEERRDLIFEGLSNCEKIKPLKPQGTFYLFCDITDTGFNSFDFCSQLLEKYLVSCIPGEPFGQDNFIRISFSTSKEQIKKGIERIREFLKNI
jgi:aspartate aminotransferase